MCLPQLTSQGPIATEKNRVVLQWQFLQIIFSVVKTPGLNYNDGYLEVRALVFDCILPYIAPPC